MDLKQCSSCRQELSYNDFYKQHTTNDGYQATCKRCNEIASKNKNNSLNTLNVSTKKCKICKLEKDLDRYHIDVRGKLGRKAECKACRQRKNRNSIKYIGTSHL